jgi:hypothetical protein
MSNDLYNCDAARDGKDLPDWLGPKSVFFLGHDKKSSDLQALILFWVRLSGSNMCHVGVRSRHFLVLV